MNTVTVACRLPHGLIIEVGNKSVELAGQNRDAAFDDRDQTANIVLTPSRIGLTEVDAEFWNAWKAQVGEDFAPLASGAIYEAKSEKEAKAILRDTKSRKTGFEGADKVAPGITEADKE